MALPPDYSKYVAQLDHVRWRRMPGLPPETPSVGAKLRVASDRRGYATSYSYYASYT